MRVVTILGKKAETRTRFMVELLNERIISEIRRLIRSHRCYEALTRIIKNGIVLKELSEKEISEAKPDLIITNRHAYWTIS